MKSLLRYVAEIWNGSATLKALVPFANVFTGRVPQTELYDFPYVSVVSGPGAWVRRTDKARYSNATLTFHIWVDANQLEQGHRIAEAIADAYADRCWQLGPNNFVRDVLDEGEPIAHQVSRPGVKIWEVVKMFTVCLERARADHTSECCEGSSSSS